MKTHWLFGIDPNKEVKFKKEIDEETDCNKCIHKKVCMRDMPKRCINFEMSNSNAFSCGTCVHNFTRFSRNSIPCFYCKDFLEEFNGKEKN